MGGPSRAPAYLAGGAGAASSPKPGAAAAPPAPSPRGAAASNALGVATAAAPPPSVGIGIIPEDEVVDSADGISSAGTIPDFPKGPTKPKRTRSWANVKARSWPGEGN